MPQTGPTFADMLGTATHLLDCCASSTEEQVQTIKMLRLVSKDVGSAVMKAATTCALQLGAKASVKPLRLVQMFSTARLEKLIITITMTSGEILYR